jgi:hypothetical protein
MNTDTTITASQADDLLYRKVYESPRLKTGAWNVVSTPDNSLEQALLIGCQRCNFTLSRSMGLAMGDDYTQTRYSIFKITCQRTHYCAEFVYEREGMVNILWLFCPPEFSGNFFRLQRFWTKLSEILFLSDSTVNVLSGTASTNRSPARRRRTGDELTKLYKLMGLATLDAANVAFLRRESWEKGRKKSL